ncbi:MAG: ImmA/IrrE family metallo-endopeptidase [Methylococcales bacterium]
MGSFDTDYEMTESWNKKIIEARRKMQNPYAFLNDKGGYDAVPNQSVDMVGNSFVISPEDIRRNSPIKDDKLKEIRDPFIKIEQVANKLLNEMWKNKRQIWLKNEPNRPIDVRDPVVALRLIGYDYDLSETLGQFSRRGQQIEVAGIIDNSLKQVRVSRQFTPIIRNFTAAHELGHAILHNANGLHRDRPLDGSRIVGSREAIEVEADKFATYFLMPQKLVRTIFKRTFDTDCFSLNEATIFAFPPDISKEMTRKCKIPRDLSRILASVECYNGQHFISLASQFEVSVEAMAIRLEELKLLRL